MTGTICCVQGCNNNSKKTRNISFHSFPQNMNRRKEWIRRINRQQWIPKKFDKICGIHFNITGKKSWQDKYPKYFPDGRVLEDDQDVQYVDMQKDLGLACNITISNNTIMRSNSTPVLTHTGNKFLDELDNIDDHTYFIDRNVMFNKILNKQNDLENEVKRLTEENEHLSKQLVELKCAMSSLECELNKQKSKMFHVNNVLKNNVELQFYTGFESADRFKIFADFIEPGYNLARRMSRNNIESNTGRKCMLSFTEQLFLVLCRLRLGLMEQDLAYRFNISTGTVSNLWSFWVDLLSSQLCQVPIWLSKALTDKYMPH